MTPEKDLVEDIQTRLAILTGLCGDHSCVFGPPKGMGTNGGCRCEVKRNPKVQMAIQLQRRLTALLTTEVESLREDKKLLGERLEAQAKESASVVAERDALRDACQQFVHWYAEDSTEFNRDSAYDAAVAALTPKG